MKNILLFITFALLLSTVACARRATAHGVGGAAGAGAWQQQDGGAAAANIEEPSLRGHTAERNVNLRTVNFAFDSSDLSEEMMAILRENANWLQANRDVRVVVEGHTDERGTIEYNLALGQRRATRVRDYYVQLGVAAGRIATISYGKEMPIDMRQNEAGWARNRRAETKVIN